MSRYDAIIVGGGPAGSTCAWQLVRMGFTPLILDRARFPRVKPCAGWITPPVFSILEIDPEDLQAHYNLMLCFRALRDTERAQHQQALYLRFKADESAQSNLGEFLQDHPHDNNERQAIHEHSAFPLEEIRRWSESASTAY